MQRNTRADKPQILMKILCDKSTKFSVKGMLKILRYGTMSKSLPEGMFENLTLGYKPISSRSRNHKIALKF